MRFFYFHIRILIKSCNFKTMLMKNTLFCTFLHFCMLRVWGPFEISNCSVFCLSCCCCCFKFFIVFIFWEFFEQSSSLSHDHSILFPWRSVLEALWYRIPIFSLACPSPVPKVSAGWNREKLTKNYPSKEPLQRGIW